MSETVCITPVSTTLNQDMELVTVSPWPVQTLVIRAAESSSDFSGNLRTQIPYEIPEAVDVRSWLAATERLLDFWDNDEDDVYDNY